MRFLESAIEVQAHREVYIAVLNGLLTLPGSKKELARRAHITPQYLSYILALDRDPLDDTTHRTPTVRVAQRIAQQVNAPREIQDSILEHMTLAHEKELLSHYSVTLDIREHPLFEIASEIERVRCQAVFATVPADSLKYYRAAVSSANMAIHRTSPDSHLLDYVDLCSIIADCQCVLNRADDAVWHAKLACAIMEGFDSLQFTHERDRFEFSLVDMLRQQGVAMDNLGLPREALRLYEQAEHTEYVRRRGDMSKSMILRDKIKALAQLPRFSITEVEYCADASREALSRRDDVDAALGYWLLAAVVAVAYVRHGDFTAARRVLDLENERVGDIVRIGPLQRVLFLRAYATLYGSQSDSNGWRHFILQAYQLASEAGLDHQIVRIEVELLAHEAWLPSRNAKVKPH